MQIVRVLQRYVRRHPFDLISMALSLALGMLLLVLILAAINGFLLRPLAVPQIDELVRIRERRGFRRCCCCAVVERPALR